MRLDPWRGIPNKAFEVISLGMPVLAIAPSRSDLKTAARKMDEVLRQAITALHSGTEE